MDAPSNSFSLLNVIHQSNLKTKNPSKTAQNTNQPIFIQEFNELH